MKKIALFSLLVFYFQLSIAQDPEIIGTWYLVGFTSDLGEIELINNNDAPQNPTLIINSNYTFEGIGACNSFSGEFVYDPLEEVYIHENFEATTDDCGNSNYNNFETLYFAHFDDTEGPSLQYIDLGSTSRLLLEFAPGFGIEFQDSVFLGMDETLEASISIFPTLASNEIQIDYPTSLKMESICVLDFRGQEVFRKRNGFHVLDISNLAQGMYFLELKSDRGSMIKKFIKK